MTLIFQRSTGYNKPAKALGRGNSSGKGASSGKGIKGQLARAGKWSKVPAHFEGGQTPLHRRLPKLRGFKRFFKNQDTIQVINLGRLCTLEAVANGDVITKESLVTLGCIRNTVDMVKVLGNGTCNKKLQFQDIELFSESARLKIEQSWGSIA
jgi:large subunit ribosomal protein L15